jgi:DNA-binding LacI/PurR family transcriptional regulator
MKKKKRVTIKDVARESGLSIRTVSRVINDDPHVKLETRKTVKRTIAKLGFEVNAVARSLKQKKTNQIVVFIDQHQGMYWGSFHNEIVQELLRRSKREGYRLLISASSADSFAEDENDGFALVKHGLCDGAIMFDSKPDDKRVSYLKSQQVPFVIVGKDITNDDTPYVDLDNEYAGYLGAQTLYQNGYRKVAFLLGDESFVVNQERARGFQRYFEDQSCPTPIIRFGVSDMEQAYRMTNQLLTDVDLDSIFISGDERALGVYRAVQEQGLQVGSDIGILGIDNLKMGEYLYPPLTTIDQPKQAFGEIAFNTLLEQLKDPTVTAKRTLITPQVVERRSLK